VLGIEKLVKGREQLPLAIADVLISYHFISSMKVNFCKLFTKYILFLAKKNYYENVFFPYVIERKPFFKGRLFRAI